MLYNECSFERSWQKLLKVKSIEHVPVDMTARYKMYKAHGQWMTGMTLGATTLALAAMGLASTSVASADTVDASAGQPVASVQVQSATPVATTGVQTPAAMPQVSVPSNAQAAVSMANSQITSVADSVNTMDSNFNGGVTQSGSVDVTGQQPSAIMSVGNSVVNRISQINSGNMELSNAASDARSAIENAGGVLKPGSTVNVSGLTSSQVSALISEGSAMVSATASGDIVIKSAVDSASPVIKGIGGDVIRDSDINTADDWTVSGIASVVTSETDTLSRVASADSRISAAVDRNKGTISNAGGVLAPGSTVDTSDLTPEQINSLAAAYQSMVDATGSGDAAILSIVNSARSAIEANGGHLVKGSNINTVDSMTGSEIASGVASHSANISQTASADAKISGAVSENHADVYNASGILSAGSEIDTSGMTSEEIASIAAHQKAMVDATGSADSDIMSHVRSDTSIIINGGGYVQSSGNINTADDMNPSQIASMEASQAHRLDQTADIDSKLASEAVEEPATSEFGGSIKRGSAIDDTSMTSSEIDDYGSLAMAKISQVNSANKLESDTEVKVSDVTNAVGGKVSAGSVWDVTNVDPSEVASVVASENDTLSAVGEGNRQIGSALTSWMNQIQNAGGTITNSGTVNWAGHTPDEVLSFAKSEAANIIATGSADARLSENKSAAQSLIEANGGHLYSSAVIDETGRSLNQIEADATSQIQKWSQVGSADVAMTSQIAEGAGIVTAGSNVNADSMTQQALALSVMSELATGSATIVGHRRLDALASMVASDFVANHAVLTSGTVYNTKDMTASDVEVLVSRLYDQLSATAAGNSAIAQASAADSSAAVIDGGKITTSHLDVTSWDAVKIKSYAASEAHALLLAASGNDSLSKALSGNSAAVSDAGATITSDTAIDGSTWNESAVNSLVASEVDNILATAKGDLAISSASSAAWKESTLRSAASDVSGLNSTQIDSIAQSVVAKINVTQKANESSSAVVARTQRAISAIAGEIFKSSLTETMDLSVDQINSLAVSEVAKLEATATADTALKSAIDANAGDINQNGGSVIAISHVNTTSLDNSAVVSQGTSQASHIAAAGNAQRAMNLAIASNTSDISNQINGGSIINAGARDVTSEDGDTIRSFGASEASRIQHVGDASRMLTSAVIANSLAIGQMGGHFKRDSVDDVTGLTNGQIDASAASQASRINHVGSGDAAIKSAMDANSKDVNFTVEDQTDATYMSDDHIDRVAGSEVSSIQHTGDASRKIESAISRNHDLINQAGGQLNTVTDRDVTGMPDAAIDSLGDSIAAHVSHTGNGDAIITSASNAYGGHIKDLTSQAAKDMTSATDQEIDRFAQSEATQMQWVASADDKLTAITGSGVHQGTSLADATAWGQGQIDSYVTSTTALAGSVDAMNAEYQRLASQIVAHGGTVDWQSGAVNVTNPSQVTSDPDLTRGLSVQASEEAVSQAASSAVTAINGLASSAVAHSVSAMVGRTVEVHNQSEVDSVVAQNKALVDSVIAKVGSVMAVQNTYPTNYSGQFVPSGSMDSLNWKGANNNIDGKGTVATIRNAGDMGSVESAARNMEIVTSAFDGDHIVQKLSWESPNQVSLVSGSLQGGSVGGYKDSNWDGSSAIYHITSGTTIKIAGGARMMSGKVQDVYVRIWNANAANNLLTIYNKDGSISAATAGPHLKNMATIGMQFWIGSQNSNEQFIMGDFLSDIDGGQLQSLSNSYLLGLGGGLCAWGDPGQGHTMNVGADWNLGVTYGNNHDPHGLLHGLDSYPDGCALTVSYGNGFVYTISNNNSPTVSGIAVSYFGSASVQSTLINRAVNLAKPVYNYQPVTVHPKHLATTVTLLTMHYQAMSLKNVPQKLALGVNGIETDYNGMSTKYTPVSVKYAAYDTTITDHYRNTYTPLKTSYKAIDNVATPLDLAAGQVVDHGGLHKLDTGYHPLSTSFMSASDYDYQTPDGKTHRGYGPLSTTYNSLATTYQNFSSDGKAMGKDGKRLNPYLTDEHGNYILDQNGHRILNPKFTGYTPLSTDYPIYSSDGTKIPPMIPDPNHPGHMIPNPRFTGYAPMSAHYQVLSSDGTKVPSTIDGKPNPHFTGYAPIKDTYPLLVDREQPQPRPVPKAPQPQPQPGVAPAPQPAPVQSVIVPAQQPAPRPQPQPALPQTNGADEAALVALGLAMASMGMVLLKKNKREIR